jgi:predicted AAA+ superfamily ATPase
MVLEIYRLNAYLRKRYKLFYLRTKDDAEIDLVIEKPGEGYILLEIKSSKNATIQHGRHVSTFSRELAEAEGWVVSLDEHDRKEGNLWLLHWRSALMRLFPELHISHATSGS